MLVCHFFGIFNFFLLFREIALLNDCNLIAIIDIEWYLLESGGLVYSLGVSRGFVLVTIVCLINKYVVCAKVTLTYWYLSIWFLCFRFCGFESLANYIVTYG